MTRAMIAAVRLALDLRRVALRPRRHRVDRLELLAPLGVTARRSGVMDASGAMPRPSRHATSRRHRSRIVVMALPRDPRPHRDDVCMTRGPSVGPRRHLPARTPRAASA